MFDPYEVGYTIVYNVSFVVVTQPRYMKCEFQTLGRTVIFTLVVVWVKISRVKWSMNTTSFSYTTDTITIIDALSS